MGTVNVDDDETWRVITWVGEMFGITAEEVVATACERESQENRSGVVRIRKLLRVEVKRPINASVERATVERRPTHRQGGRVGTVELDEETHALVRFAARMFDATEAEVVARAVKTLSAYAVEEARPTRDPWAPVDVVGEYGDHRVTGKYLPATQRLTVTSDPIAGQTFKSPSGPAMAIVAALNPDRTAKQTNGWRFWHLVDTGERLQVLRKR